MVRSEETDVAESAELPGLCYGSVPSPGGTEGQRGGKAWKSSEAERECPSAEAHTQATEETAWNKAFSIFYYPQTQCFFGECNIPSTWLKHQQKATETKRNREILALRAQLILGKSLSWLHCSSWENRYSLQSSISSWLCSPGYPTLRKRASPSLLLQLIMRVTPFDTRKPDICLLDNGPREPQIL